MKIYNKSVPTEIINEIRLLVKDKEEFKNLDNTYIDIYIKKFFEQNFKKIDNFSEKAIKQVVKFVRQRNRNSYGLFQKSVLKREELLQQLKKSDFKSEESLKIHAEILESHVSTLERLPYYCEFWEMINSFKPKSILDVGCGLNPLSIIYSDKHYKYYAVEKNKLDASYLNKYFKMYKIKGEAISFDVVSSYEQLKSYNVDICLMLKVLDIFEDEIKNISYDIVNNLNCKYLVASFNLNVVSGKKLMKLKNRPWFEKLLQRLDWKYETKVIGLEVFYLCEKV